MTHPCQYLHAAQYLHRSILWGICSILYSGSVYAQELVPDAKFEAVIQSESVLRWKHWQNPAHERSQLFFAAADVFQKKQRKQQTSPQTIAGINPKTGEGMAGLTAYNRALGNFREYLYTPLTKALEVGKTYRISLNISQGMAKAYGMYHVAELGCYFSTQPPVQNHYEPLPAVPQLKISTAPNERKWQQLSAEFLADEPYTYLTFGNFLPDSLCQISTLEQGQLPLAYYFIDLISLTENTPADEPAAKAQQSDTIYYKLAALRDLAEKADFNGRKLNLQQSVTTSSVKLMLKVWDDKQEDEDIISLSLNGEWVLQEYMVRKRPLKVMLNLLPDQDNYLVLYAHNMGRTPPNTAAISFKDMGKKKRVLLKSDLQTCGTLRLIYQP